MKRLSVHAVFALVATASAAVVVAQAVRLQQARDLNAAIVAASQAPVLPAASAAPASAVDTTATATAASGPPAEPSGMPRDAPRAVRLAHATALAQAGAFDAAFKGYSGLIEPGRVDAAGRQALYNLGNMYLRQGLGLRLPAGGGAAAPASPAEAVPLIELAKQRYRDLLRLDPQDWDARYNLERALRAAPEEHEAAVEEPTGPVERRNVLLRGRQPGDLP